MPFAAPPLTNEFYAESYKLRKEASSMTSAFTTWFDRNGSNLLEEVTEFDCHDGVFSVLSVGSGEGDIDLAIICTLIPHLRKKQMRLKYVALEPNPAHRQRFLEKLQDFKFEEFVEISVREDHFSATDTPRENQSYHLIFFIHVLYYFRDPYSAIQQAQNQLKLKGRVVIVHQEATGIPKIQSEYMVSVKGDQEYLLTAEKIKELLIEKGRDFSYQSMDAKLDITECLASSETGIKIMSFCMECDLRHLDRERLDHLTGAFRSLANFTPSGQAWIEEPIGVVMVPSLTLLSAKTQSGSRVPADRDPTQDYWQLSNSFNWSELLSQQGKNESVRVLDVACGTGRWIDALKHYLELESGSIEIIYDLLDPNQRAIYHAAQSLHTPFKLGEQYVTGIQDAELSRGAYDLLWSMHGFYNIPREDLPISLDKCVNSLKRSGAGLIALATRDSFYVDFYDRYLNAFHNGQGTRFTSAEDVVAALSRCNIKHSVSRFSYKEPRHVGDLAALEYYIGTESIANSFNKSKETEKLSMTEDMSFERLITCPPIQNYLESLISDSFYYFPQEVWMIEFYH